MFEVIFYRDKNGRSRIVEYLDELQQKMSASKDARINREKILVYLAALAKYGVAIGKPYVKHIEGDIWELRPLRNRIFFFCCAGDKIVLLHYYIKKSQKLPKREIQQAHRNMNDYKERSLIK
ncbi:MAG: type II toxin-antitoxin system RelE/ParE family toxin [Eubacterium sp.]|nr:type II toxin-antitoxin system RelE/ParE family toxin [Eubacterium sp.]